MPEETVEHIEGKVKELILENFDVTEAKFDSEFDKAHRLGSKNKMVLIALS